MDLRLTTLALCTCLLSCSAVSQAQTNGLRSFRIGLLSDTSYFSEHATAAQWDSGEQLTGLRQGMRDLGVVEGKDWILIPRIANRDHELLNKLAAELVRAKVDVIAASSTTAAMAAKQATETIPIVAWGFLGEAVPVGPGTNITGFKQPPVSEYIKQLQMLLPNLKRLAILYDTSYAVAPPLLEDAKNAAQSNGLQAILVEVADSDDLAVPFGRMAQQHAQAVLVLNNPKFVREASKLAGMSIQYRLPMATPYRQVADAGGLIAHHPDWEKIWRRGARMIQQILNGTPPTQIPVQTGDMRYYINTKTADTLGLTIPTSLREQAQLIGADSSTENAVTRAQSPPPAAQTITENLIRNDRVHVSRITHAPRQHVRMHYAPPLTEVFLTDAHYILIWPDGKREEHSYKAGDAAWFSGGLHATESLDDHEQQIMIVVPVSDPNPERAEGDPFIGTFVARSDSASRAGARSLSFARDGDWQTGILRIVTNNGAERTFIYRAKFNGNEYPYTEPANLPNTVSLRRVDRKAFVMTEKRDGKVVAIYTRLLSEDGKMLTNFRWQVDQDGQEVTHSEVLERH